LRISKEMKKKSKLKEEEKKENYLKEFVLFGLIIFFYLLFLLTNITKSNNEEQTFGEIIPLMPVNILLVLLLISLLKTKYSSPGYIPKSWNKDVEEKLGKLLTVEKATLEKYLRKQQSEDAVKDEEMKKLNVKFKKDEVPIEHLQQLAFERVLKKMNIRFCLHCQMFKPPRSHHCRKCGKCILKLDHHTDFLGNCVGFYNYKSYINSVLYEVLFLWVLVYVYITFISDPFNRARLTWGHFILVNLSYFVAIGLCVFMSFYLFFHFWLIITGRTSLEMLENKQEDYNYGIWKNFQSVFGSNPLLWLIPITPDYPTQGLNFKKLNSKIE